MLSLAIRALKLTFRRRVDVGELTILRTPEVVLSILPLQLLEALLVHEHHFKLL